MEIGSDVVKKFFRFIVFSCEMGIVIILFLFIFGVIMKGKGDEVFVEVGVNVGVSYFLV